MRGRKTVAVCAAICAGALMATGCGSSDDDKSSQSSQGTKSSPKNPAVDAARAAVAEARRGPTGFEAGGPAFDVSKARGKTAYLIAANLSIPFIKEIEEGTVEGLKAAGVKTVVVDHKNDPSAAAKLIDQAISRKVDVIVSASLPAAILAEPLRRAKAAGIPFIQQFETDAEVTPEMSKLGVTAQVSECSACAGSLMADWAIMDSGAKVKSVGVFNSGIPYNKWQKEALTEQLESDCAGCSLSWKDVEIPANWATKLPTIASVALKDPTVNYLFPVYSDMATLMAPSIKAAGAADRTKLITYNATVGSLQAIKKGDVAADMGQPAAWIGWATADQVLRILTGEQPVADAKVPLRLFDKTNIDSVDLSAPSDRWYNVDFRAGYRELWGLNG